MITTLPTTTGFHLMGISSQGMPVHLREVVGYLDETLESGAVHGLRAERPPGRGRARGRARRHRRVGVGRADRRARSSRRGSDRRAPRPRVGRRASRRSPGRCAQRLKLLLGNDVSLAAYHLPLDKHARLGNNAGLADALGLGASAPRSATSAASRSGSPVAWPRRCRATRRSRGSARGVCDGAPPRFVFPYGPDVVRKVGICSGAASDLLEAAAAAGCDLFLTGELAERAARSREGAADHAGRGGSRRDRGVRPDAARRRAAHEVPDADGPVRAVAVTAVVIEPYMMRRATVALGRTSRSRDSARVI